MKKGFVVVLLALVLTAFAIVPAFADGDYTIAVVPKLTSIAWFQRMEVGVK